MFKGEGLTVLDPENGHLLGSYATTSRDYCNSLTPVFVENRILVSNTGANPAALLSWEGGTLKPAWTNGAFALLFNNALSTTGACSIQRAATRRQRICCLTPPRARRDGVSDSGGPRRFVLSDAHWIFFTRKARWCWPRRAGGGPGPGGKVPAVGGKCYATPALAEGCSWFGTTTGTPPPTTFAPGGATAGSP